MATVVWTGAAGVTRQLNTVTPGAANSATYNVVINGKIVSYVSDASATVAEITAGLVAALQASTEPEFTGLTYTDLTTAVTIRGAATGEPFTQTSSATAGSLTTAVTTAAAGPNYWNVAGNWSGGVYPSDDDDVIVDNSAVSILYGLDTSANRFGSLTVGAGFTGTIGLPERNDAGYQEYRPTRLKIDGPTGVVSIEGQGSGRVKLFVTIDPATVNVYSAGSPADANLPAVLISGDVAANVVNVVGGSVGLAALPGSVLAVATLRVGGGENSNAQVTGGAGLALTTLNLDGGTVNLAAGLTTLNQVAGTLTVTGSAAATTLNVDGGTVFWQSAGTITTVRVGNDGVMDFARDLRPRTVTNSTVNAAASWRDPFHTVTYTNPLVLNRCSVADLRELDLGTHITLQVAAGP
jgi:trimeric autotransporter adhesin